MLRKKYPPNKEKKLMFTKITVYSTFIVSFYLMCTNSWKVELSPSSNTETKAPEIIKVMHPQVLEPRYNLVSKIMLSILLLI